MAKTVAFPVIGIGLDANPLKKGLQDAKASVAGTVAGIQDSAKKLSGTPFDIYQLRPDAASHNAGVMDVVDKFNARKAAEVAAKEAAKKAKAEQQIQKAAQTEQARFAEEQSRIASDRARGIAERFQASQAAASRSTYMDNISALGSGSSAKGGGLFGSFLLGPETFGRIKAGLSNLRGAFSTIPQYVEIEGEKTRVVGLSVGEKIASGIRAGLASAITKVNLPSVIAGGLRMGGNVVGAVLSGPANLLGMIARLSMPLNQMLELAGKAQRILGAPMRAQMAMEANNADVVAGGQKLMGSSTLSGTMARFERSFEEMLANIWRALNDAFDIQAWIEAIRGGMTAIGSIIKAAFGPIEKIKDANWFESMFKAGGQFLIDTFETLGKISVAMVNQQMEVARVIMELLGKSEFTKDQQKLIVDWQDKNRRVVGAPGLGAVGDPLGILGNRQIKLPGNRNDAINALAAGGQLPAEFGKMTPDAITGIAKNARNLFAGVNFNPGITPAEIAKANATLADFTRGLQQTDTPLQRIAEFSAAAEKTIQSMWNAGAEIESVEAARAAADKKIADMTKEAAESSTKAFREFTNGLNTGKTPIEQAQQQYASALERIDEMAKVGGTAAEIQAAKDAALQQFNFSILESLKPMMEMQNQSRFSVSFEPNSQALIESMIRAQYGAGADNPQERMARAIDLQAKILADQKKLQEQQLEALRAIRNKPGAVFVGGAG